MDGKHNRPGPAKAEHLMDWPARLEACLEVIHLQGGLYMFLSTAPAPYGGAEVVLVLLKLSSTPKIFGNYKGPPGLHYCSRSLSKISNSNRELTFFNRADLAPSCLRYCRPT